MWPFLFKNNCEWCIWLYAKSNLKLFFFSVGVIALLDEPNVLLKEFALQKLNEIVDEFWPEIADSVEKM